SAAHKQSHARVIELEQQLAAARELNEELNSRFASEQHRASESQNRINELERELASKENRPKAVTADLEQQISQGVAALARATADLAIERGQRQRSEERVAALNLQLQQMHEESIRA